jgi:hypothetical protein
VSLPPERVFVGKDKGFAHTARVYRLPDALEVDASDRYQISRRRVFYDEVRLVTLHAGNRRTLGFVLGAAALLWLLFALATRGTAADAVFYVLAALFALASLPYLLLPNWIVTVQGKRTHARMRFGPRETRARAAYAEVARLAADAQRALAARHAEEAPPPAEEAFPEPPDVPALPPQQAEQGDEPAAEPEPPPLPGR